MKACATVELATVDSNGYPDVRTILNAANTEAENLNLHFLTMVDSPKMAQIAADPRACLYFYDPATHKSVRLYGDMSVDRDTADRIKYWRDEWLHSGWRWDDPNLVVLVFASKSYKFYVGNDREMGNLGE